MSNQAASPTAESTHEQEKNPQPVRMSDYAQVSGLLLAFFAGLYAVAQLHDTEPPRITLLLGPIFALVALTALVWLTMVVLRNTAILRGLSAPDYYLAYAAKAPADWIERPARTWNNLMQAPTLFYVVCVLMIVTHTVDRAQLAYAWIYVALRTVHACIYIGWNYLPYRFATWVASCVTLGVMWIHFAVQSWPGL